MPKIINPVTGRLVNKDGPTGKKILKNRRNHLEGTIKSQKRYSYKKTQIHNTNTRVKKHTKNSNSWIDAITQARSELDITGFHAIKKGTPLYERAKEIQIGGCLTWDIECKRGQAKQKFKPSTLSRLIELPRETKKRKHLKHALKAKECWRKILSYTIIEPSRNIYLLDRNRITAKFPYSWEPTKKKFDPKWEPITGMYRHIPDEDSKNQPWSTLGLLKNSSRFEEDPKFNTHKSTFDAWMNGKKIILEKDRTESSHGEEQRYLRFFDNEWAWRVTKFVTMYDTYKIIWEKWFTPEDRRQWNDSKDKYLSVQDWETTATDLDHVRLAAYLDLVNLLHGPNSARQLLSIAINNFWRASIWLQSIDDYKTKELLGDRFESNIFYFGEGRISSGKDAEYKPDGLHEQMQEWAYGLPTEYRHNDALEQLERSKIAMNSNLANGHENKKLNPSEIFGEHAKNPKKWFTENSRSMGRYPIIYQEEYKWESDSPFMRTQFRHNGQWITVNTGGRRYWDWYYAPLY